MDLSNARIIEWVFKSEGYRDELRVANRDVREAPFRFGGATLMTEAHAAAQVGVRVVEEFPAPSLAEIVRGAPAFLFVTASGGREAIAWRASDGTWQSAIREAGAELRATHRTLESLSLYVDVASVVPLVAREVVS